MERKEHLTKNGLLKIDTLRLEMNRGLQTSKKKLVLIQDQLVFQDLSKLESSLS